MVKQNVELKTNSFEEELNEVDLKAVVGGTSATNELGQLITRTGEATVGALAEIGAVTTTTRILGGTVQGL